MVPETDDQIRADAIGWHIRLRDDGADGWDAFVRWLEQDLAHSDAYDAVALADAELEPVLRKMQRI